MSLTLKAPAAAAKPQQRGKPFTSSEYLESLRDGREIWIYGERVKDVTTHPAFRNTARMIARLYDALHDPARKDVLTTADRHRQRRLHAQASTRRRATPKSWSAPATPSPSGRASPTAGSAAAPTTRRRSSPRSAPTPTSTSRSRTTRALVQEGPGRGVLRQPRHRQPAGRSRQAARRGQRRLHARREGDRRRPDRQRRQGRRDDLDA